MDCRLIAMIRHNLNDFLLKHMQQLFPLIHIIIEIHVSKKLKHNFFPLIFLIYFEIPVHEDA